MRESLLAPAHPFSRLNETDDTEYYKANRSSDDADSDAHAAVRDLVGRLVIEKEPAILDLMAGSDSHIPESTQPSRVVGVGLDEAALLENKAISERLVHDLNKNHRLPLKDQSFDAVFLHFAVPYMTRPLEVFREAGRLLKPAGLFMVTFSTRVLKEKAVNLWLTSRTDERLLLLLDYFVKSQALGTPRVCVANQKQGNGGGAPATPVYAVYAERTGSNVTKRDGPGRLLTKRSFSPDEIAERKRHIKDTLECPYCGEKLEKWMVPDSPFLEWPNEYFYVCFNDMCPYFNGGWDRMAALGNFGSYRLLYDPIKDNCYPTPVLSTIADRG